MTSIIKLHAISGSMGESPPCYILQIDDFRFLLDCGWDEKFDMEFINELKKYVHKIDAVLLSHSDTYHLGALPYLVGKCGLKCPVYATIPVFKMGQMFMYDWYLSRHNTEQFDLFNLDDIDAAFDKILQLEYSHPVNLKGRGHGISITALPAGHSLGGSIWKISKTGVDDIYYAIDHNNKKERHLNGCEMEKIQRPGILITNAFNALYVQEKRRKRDEMLMGMMQQTMRNGGNALIATDSAGRALELILMLDQMWRMKDSGLAPYSLVFLNNVAFNVLEFAKSQLEWMSEKLIKAFESQKTNPFQLKNVIICHTLIELSQVPSPKVVVTSTSDLECGFSRDLFLQWCQDPRSCVILTNRSSPGTLARNLIDEPSIGRKLELEVKQKVRLEGKELEDYYQQKRNDKKRKIDIVELEDSSDDEPEVVFSGVIKKNGGQKHDLFIRAGDGSVSLDDSSVFKLNNNNHPSFPSQDSSMKKRRFDDYGETIRHEDFKENGKCTKDKAAKRSHLSSVSEPSDSDPPTKTMVFKQMFSVNAQVMFIDFEGRSDVESLLKMIQEMQPKRLVLVRGQVQSTMALEALAKKWLPKVKIYKPSLGQAIDLTSGSQILQIRLKGSLTSSLQFKTVRDCEVAWVDGNLVNKDNQSNVEDLHIDPLQAGPTLELLSSKEVPPHEPMVVNRLRLTELKQILAQNGIESEFKNGILQCTSPSGVVYIQKDSETRSIHIEAEGLPEKYYLIRSLLYSQLAML